MHGLNKDLPLMLINFLFAGSLYTWSKVEAELWVPHLWNLWLPMGFRIGAASAMAFSFLKLEDNSWLLNPQWDALWLNVYYMLYHILVFSSKHGVEANVRTYRKCQGMLACSVFNPGVLQGNLQMKRWGFPLHYTKCWNHDFFRHDAIRWPSDF